MKKYHAEYTENAEKILLIIKTLRAQRSLCAIKPGQYPFEVPWYLLNSHLIMLKKYHAEHTENAEKILLIIKTLRARRSLREIKLGQYPLKSPGIY